MARKPNPSGTRNCTIRLSSQTYSYLERLAELGIHGVTAAEVGKNLVGREVERLIREKFLTIQPSRK
jgi:hypothetical protein